MGSVIGIVLALCVGLLIFVVKDVKGVRTKAKKILFSFLSTEVLLALQLGFDGFDFYTEIVVHNAPPVNPFLRPSLSQSSEFGDRPLLQLHAFC